MSTLKKQQHYVWQHYLKPWTIDNKIFCLRDGKDFNPSLKNIGQERFFYKVHELGAEEIRFFQILIKNMMPSVSKSMNFIFNLYNDIANSKSDYQIKCGIENLHTIVENIGKQYLTKLYSQDIDFLKLDIDKQRFGLFLGVQYTRTNKMRQKTQELKLTNEKLDMKKLSRMTPFIFSEIIARWIYDFGKIKFLINDSDTNFITSDQPVFNLLADPYGIEKPKKMELFYPIAPKLAIHINEKEEGKFKIDEKNVLILNRLMEEHSYEQLYAKNLTDFHATKPYTKPLNET